MSWPSWTSSVTRWWRWPRAPCSPRAPWPNCGAAPRSWRPTLSADDGTPHGAELRATGVTAGYGGDPVIRDITVQAEPGQVVSLVGANGSGKSTLLKSLVGVVRVSAGTVTVG